MREALGGIPQHAGILDPHLFPEQGEFLPEPIILLLEGRSRVEAVGGPAPCKGWGEVSQRDGV
jgi:hypothetical protein